MIKKTKFFFAWNEDEEALYLENQALKGLHLVNAFPFRYYFEEGEKRLSSYQFDFPSYDVTASGEEEYLQIYQDDGWEFITRVGGWYYFRKDYQEGEEKPKIFSDRKSYVNKLKRLLIFLGITGLPLYNLVFLYNNILATDTGSSAIGLVYQFRYLYFALAGVHLYALIRVGMKYYQESKKLKGI